MIIRHCTAGEIFVLSRHSNFVLYGKSQTLDAEALKGQQPPEGLYGWLLSEILEPEAVCVRHKPFAVDLRSLVRRECQDCKHYWQQPSPTGRCPKCHSENVVNDEMTRTEAARV